MIETIPARKLPFVTLKPKEERRIQAGHLWAFSNELVMVPKEIPSGSIVRLVKHGGETIGCGFFNPNSLIAVRLITRSATIDDEQSFFREKLIQAISRRASLAEKRNAVRLVHGESDFLPGLIVDRFNDVVSFQMTSQGFEVRKELIITLLRELLKPRTLVERNSTSMRKLEGLPQIDQVAIGDDPETIISDDRGSQFRVNVLTGQKTGFFVDQMENRTLVWQFLEGNRALDLFSNEGGFAINLARAGANVLAVDSSKAALERLEANAGLNSISDKITTHEADCFDFLKEHGETYDLVILDPPALVKSKKDINVARKAYLNLNTNAMRRTRPGGVLMSASCSHHLTREMLLDVLMDSAVRAGRAVSILAERGAGIDHPVLLAMPETAYLKFFVLRIH